MQSSADLGRRVFLLRTKEMNFSTVAFLELDEATPPFTAGYNPQANGQAEAGVYIVTA